MSMLKNVAGQNVSIQMGALLDGTPITTGSAMYVTIDGGTQTAGGGTLTHKGFGSWNYAPTQAETNGTHIAFTLQNVLGINATLNVYTDTGDAFARLGAPAGASVSADIAAVKADTAAVKTKTDFLPSATAGAAGGVFIAGANATTSISGLTTAIIGDITGNLSGSVGSVTGLTAANLDATISSRMATYTQPTGFLAATFPGGTVANTTNITAGTITTVSGNVDGSVGSVVGLTASNLDTTVSSRLAPTVAGRTIDISAAGEAGIDWANIGSPTAVQNLSNTTISSFSATAALDANIITWAGFTVPRPPGSISTFT